MNWGLLRIFAAKIRQQTIKIYKTKRHEKKCFIIWIVGAYVKCHIR